MAEISKALVLKHKNEYEKPYEKNLEYFRNWTYFVGALV
jgi:hypothetical protein